MRRIQLISAMVIVGLLCGVTRAEVIWQWTYEASGSGTANVFDGGPPVFDERSTTGPSDASMSFGATDSTGQGSFAARARAAGSSDIILTADGSFRFRVDFIVGYFPSPFPGGDNPGGEAEGELSSVIEFVMPADEIGWSYQLDIDNTFPFPFTGSTDVVVENVTQSEVLLELSSDLVPGILTTLMGDTGDVIRSTSVMSGGGGMGPGSRKIYGSILDMTFTIPEPGTLLLLLCGCVATRRKQRRHKN